jgi:hypothetical protein
MPGGRNMLPRGHLAVKTHRPPAPGIGTQRSRSTPFVFGLYNQAPITPSLAHLVDGIVVAGSHGLFSV